MKGSLNNPEIIVKQPFCGGRGFFNRGVGVISFLFHLVFAIHSLRPLFQSPRPFPSFLLSGLWHPVIFMFFCSRRIKRTATGALYRWARNIPSFCAWQPLVHCWALRPLFFEFDFAATHLFILLFFDVFVLYILQKSLFYYFARQVRKAGRNRGRVLVVGTGVRAEQFLAVVKNNCNSSPLFAN